MEDLIVLGAGNTDVIDLIESINQEKNKFNFLGFLDKDDDLKGKEILNYPIFGNDSLLNDKFSTCSVIINIMSSPMANKKIANNIKKTYGISKFPNLIHPSAYYNYSSIADMGNIIYKDVNVATRTSIGTFNIIYPNVTIGHEVKIGNHNLFALNVTIGARTIIGNENLFGNSSTLSLGLKVGNCNQIGVGSVVFSDVKDNESLVGNPAIKTIDFLKDYYRKKN